MHTGINLQRVARQIEKRERESAVLDAKGSCNNCKYRSKFLCRIKKKYLPSLNRYCEYWSTNATE